MDAAVILALISNLYQQLIAAQQENVELRTELEKLKTTE